MAIDYTTPVGLVRLNITDLDDTSQLLTDEQIEGLLTASDDSVNRATAKSLHIIATSEVMLAKKISTQDLTSDGPAVARALMDQAAHYAALADQEDGTASFVGYVAPSTDPRREAEEFRWPAW